MRARARCAEHGAQPSELPKDRCEADAGASGGVLKCRIWRLCEVVHPRRMTIVRNTGFSHDSPDASMSSLLDAHRCIFCETGKVSRSDQEIAFKQHTAKGYVFCHVIIPMDLCDHCGMKTWDCDAEAIIEDAVLQESERLSSNCEANLWGELGPGAS